MQVNRAGLRDFIDDSYIPLSPTTKLGLALLIPLLALFLFIKLLYLPQYADFRGQQEIKGQRVAELKLTKGKVSGLARLKGEVKLARDLFHRGLISWPKDKEIPQLLKDISTLGADAGLDFLSFKPLAEVQREFYKEIPMAIKLRGSYREMGDFFYRLSKLDRIVTVASLNINNPKQDGKRVSLGLETRLLSYSLWGNNSKETQQ